MKMGVRGLKKERILTLVICIVIFLFNIRSIAILNGPYMFNDELGYLGNAAALAGRDWHNIMQNCAWYGFGWSIIIAPLMAVFSDMRIIYRCINVLNALSVVGVFLMQRRMLKEMFKDTSGMLVTAVSACVCFFPSILVNSSMAWSEIWLLFMFTVLSYLLYCLLKAPKAYKSAIFGFLLYYFYVCHNRMIGVLIAGVITYAVLVLAKKVDRKSCILFLVSLAVSVACFGAIKDYIISLNWRAGPPGGNDLEGGLARIADLFTAVGAKNFICVLCSQFLTLCVSSFGMIPAGIFFCLRETLGAIKNKKFPAMEELWLALSIMSMIAISALSAGSRADLTILRLDHVFYSRYTEPTCMMVMTYGFLSVDRLRQDKQRLYAISVYGVIVSACALASFLAVRQLSNPVFNWPNASGLAFVLDKFNEPRYFLFVAALATITGSILVVLMFRGNSICKYIALVAVACVCIWSAFAAGRVLTRSQKDYMGELSIVDAVESIDTSEYRLYSMLEGTINSYYQCMLPSVTLYRSESMSVIPDEEYYAIIAAKDFFDDVHYEILAMSDSGILLIHVSGSLPANDSVYNLPLSSMNLKEISSFETDRIHVESVGGGLAFYGPYIGLKAGDYELKVDLSVESDEALGDYGFLQIYSNSRREYFGETVLTPDMANSGRVQVSVLFTLPEDINDIEIYLQTRGTVVYDVYGFDLTKGMTPAQTPSGETLSVGPSATAAPLGYAVPLAAPVPEDDMAVDSLLPTLLFIVNCLLLAGGAALIELLIFRIRSGDGKSRALTGVLTTACVFLAGVCSTGIYTLADQAKNGTGSLRELVDAVETKLNIKGRYLRNEGRKMYFGHRNNMIYSTIYCGGGLTF